MSIRAVRQTRLRSVTCQNSESLIVLSYVNESTSKRLSISNRSRQQLSMLLSDVKQCSQLEMDSRDSWKEFVSVEAYITGIMFYGGRENL